MGFITLEPPSNMSNDQSIIKIVLFPLLQVPKSQPVTLVKGAEDIKHYDEARTCVEELALYLKPLSNTRGPNNIYIPLQCGMGFYINPFNFTLLIT